jgi:hypothetical protein
LANGIVNEVSFVGSYERLSVQLIARLADVNNVSAPQAGKSQTTFGQTIIATRPRPEAVMNPLHVGDRVMVGLSSFTVLPDSK